MRSDDPKKISIAMATFNGEQYLLDQLSSLRKQTLLPYELVICDDGSTDSTLDLATEFSVTSPFPVRMYRNDARLGHHRNFMKAASLCHGDWIAFCDQDDYWLDNKLSASTAYLNQWPYAMLLVHVASVVDENLSDMGNRRWPKIDRLIVQEALTGSCVSFIKNPGHACVFNAKLIRESHQRVSDASYRMPVCDAMSHDYWVSLLAHTFGKVIYIPDILVLHRRHKNSTTGSGSDKRVGASVRAALGVGAKEYRIYAELANGYAECLDRICQAEGFIWKDRARKGYDYYQEVGQLLQQRAVIYDGQLIRRLNALGTLLIKKAYSSAPKGYGLGLRAMAKDTFYTLRAA